MNGAGGNDDRDGFTPETAKLTIGNATGTVNTGGTVNIADGTYTGTGNWDIYIDRNMTITGQSQTDTIIDAENSGQIFYINSGFTVTIQNLTIQNGTSSSGGAIYNNGNLTVSDTTFIGNTATSTGGAIYSTGSLTVENCTFNNNTASSGSAISITGTSTVTGSTFKANTVPYGAGGAILNNGALTVTDSNFTENEGGAISNNGILTVIDSNFTENEGITIDSYGTLTVNGSTFTNNNANGYYGGAINNYGTSNVTGSTFTNNTAYIGGAIKNGGTSSVVDSTFTVNTADEDGGAIYNDGTLNVIGSTFTENIATNNGGAIYNEGDLDVENSTFTNNDAYNGGAIYGGNFNVENSTFTENTATGVGGAINNSAGPSNITASTFTNNTANGTISYQGGGAIQNHATLTVTDSTFTNNKANGNRGGAIYNREYGTLTVIGSTFTGNTANGAGGAIYNENKLNVTSSTFHNNTASSGGAIYNVYTKVLDVIGSTFEENTAASYGGAIYNEGSGALNFNRIVGNAASTSGDAIYMYAGSLDATNNWWGSNADPKSITNLITGYPNYVNTTSWIVLTVTANPTTINNGGTSQVTADLNHNSADDDISSQGHVPDGIPVTFTATKGSVNPASSSLVDGSRTSTFTANGMGTATVTATIDDQPVNVNINIIATEIPTKTTVNAVSGYAGGTVPLKANITANGSNVNEGQVRFTVNGIVAGTVKVANGVATLNWKIPSNWKGKTYTILANYLGTTNYTASNKTNTLTVKPTANLVFTKTVNSGTHYYGDTIYYYLTVKNNGPDSATGVSIHDKLPGGLNYQSSSATKGSYKLNTSTWTIGTIQVGQTAKLTIKAIVNKVGTIKNTATLTQSTRTTPVSKSVSFNVPGTVTIGQLIATSKTIKNYYEKNKKLPASLKVGGQTLTMPQILDLLVTATINISKKNFKPIPISKVGNAPSPSGSHVPGKLNSYVTVAQYIKTFINNNKRAPNYAVTTLGKIPYSKLVYMYAKVVNFYGQHNRLPNWVATYQI